MQRPQARLPRPSSRCGGVHLSTTCSGPLAAGGGGCSGCSGTAPGARTLAASSSSSSSGGSPGPDTLGSGTTTAPLDRARRSRHLPCWIRILTMIRRSRLLRWIQIRMLRPQPPPCWIRPSLHQVQTQVLLSPAQVATALSTSCYSLVGRPSRPGSCYGQVPCRGSEARPFGRRGAPRRPTRPGSCYSQVPRRGSVARSFGRRGAPRRPPPLMRPSGRQGGTGGRGHVTVNSGSGF